MPKFNLSVSLQQKKLKINVQIFGADLQDAERKLRQMYPYCEVMRSEMIVDRRKNTRSSDIEEMLSLIVEEHREINKDASSYSN